MNESTSQHVWLRTIIAVLGGLLALWLALGVKFAIGGGLALIGYGLVETSETQPWPS